MSILLFIAFILSIRYGAVDLDTAEILRSIFTDAETTNRSIIWKLRMPRTLIAGLVGMCLSVAGCILQGVMKNPLASPTIIGVNSGAGLAAALTLVLWPEMEYLLTPAAFLGAFATTWIIYIISWKDGIKPLRMVLAGVAISSVISAIINTILIFFPDRITNQISFTIGTLSAKMWSDFRILLPYAAVGIFLAIVFSKKLNILLLGDEIASNLGVNIEKTRLILIGIASLLAASSVSIVGMLGFVGLIIPHMTRLIVGSDNRFLIPASALTGALVIMTCDTVARIIAKPMEIPVGIIMSLIGAPFFLFLLRRRFKYDD
ncbi:FecCD family ABC transporter permease [Dethiosulfatibacter aminovorans]|uniref:FecCD family ABC transporter permease n=1 Tax=Dethiosulfatibacter aminovorans TaxID=332095 RepID=UPI001FE8B266|nr:iron ABC transporter permease [Dethiosulfatibacter aminovorans]